MTTHKLHVIAIGGIMTSGMARLYQARGWEVSGSDGTQSALTDELQAEGITVTIGHRANEVAPDTDLVIYSLAITPGSPGDAALQSAKKAGIRCQSLDEAVAEMTHTMFTISISGVHGKSTTTGMVARLLIEAGLDPTVLIGTKMPELDGRNVRVGKSKYLVLEADDYARKFTHYRSAIAVINNIEAEHLDYYGDEAAVIRAFADFIAGLTNDGTLIVNGQDAKTMALAHQTKLQPTQKLVIYNEANVAHHDLQVIGDFNQANAEAAACVGRVLGIDEQQITTSLHGFTGTWRRQEKLADGIYSDYGHHPTEVAAVIHGFKQHFKDKKLLVVFQPHQADRTQRFFEDFLHAFDDADELIMLPIFVVPGRDEGVKITSAQLIDAMNKLHSRYEADFSQAFAQAKAEVADGKTVALFLGAGPIDANLRAALANH